MPEHMPELFGSEVFNDSVMRARLPKDTYRAIRRTIRTGQHLDLDVANVVASAMKDWAIERGATHFTHWFQPMTGVTAEKHDSFISPDGSGHVIMEFSGKELVRGEPDASSFPSGGLRATFEARGYTTWDPTSYAFLKDGTLCIPTAFCSYSGEALDQKTPLLRSMEVLNAQALRILKLFGDTETTHVNATIGPEQEYFLIDKSLWLERPDLRYCGRTLFGARPPKGQEMDDHYFGAIKTRVADFMKDLNRELWKLGVMAKTEHNEVAPAQHELAPLYDTVNIAADHNQLTMELLKRVADRHGLACLLHEKPFAGVNGSGKHNNWSIATDTGVNLFEPGATPSQNARFLLFLVAVIRAVDEHQDLLRLSVASAGNDLRLGANEAPPAIVSIFLGDELTEILNAIESGTLYHDREKSPMEIGATVLPHFLRDTTDRNRTSPFAFTGNKFEFRMPGSSFSVSFVNTVLNTIVADTLRGFAETLESAEDFQSALTSLIRETISAHKRILSDGNNYSDDWVAEAHRRGLLNLKSTVDALPYLIEEKNISLFERNGVLHRAEILARYEILLENYAKCLNIEALTMIDMVKKGVIPSVLSWQNALLDVLTKKKAVGLPLDASLETAMLEKVSALSASLAVRLSELENAVLSAKSLSNALETARYFRNHVYSAMGELRITVDELETLVGREYWAYPTYGELLYSVN
ncbi:MAG: glutamine synthetase III [Eubacteriales bacterium]|nr:glutamine synthetase III [Clostridiales bacterium]MDY3070713.1 glutamine synthetase III [Eubacteriales bacterium]MDY3285322.1 glutamine synthetase III [Eubacteriales bacterium]